MTCIYIKILRPLNVITLRMFHGCPVKLLHSRFDDFKSRYCPFPFWFWTFLEFDLPEQIFTHLVFPLKQYHSENVRTKEKNDNNFINNTWYLDNEKRLEENLSGIHEFV